jgi:hypothetical protein
MSASFEPKAVCVQKSKLCPFVIKSGLPPDKGSFTWRPINTTVPLATYFVRAFVMKKSLANPSTTNPVAYGNSVGYFQAST